MAALSLKRLLNHDDDSDDSPARRPILHWEGNSYLEEYARYLPLR
jgi:hypothetical protein